MESMNTKVMEGLVGANNSMRIVNTPMKVYEQAKRQGDSSTMDRAMGYASKFAEKAKEYTKKADEGMEEEVKQAREKKKIEREKTIENHKENSQNLESKTEQMDKIELSEDGKAILEESIATNGEQKVELIKTPILYAKTGGISQTKQNISISVSI